MKVYDWIIIGAGASGVLSAILLAQKGFEVLLLEKQNKIAKKLRASGNGRCNISNLTIEPKSYLCSSEEFLKSSLQGYDYKAIQRCFLSLGLPLTSSSDGRAFPCSLEAAGVVGLLESHLDFLKVKLLLNSPVTSIAKKKNLFTLVANNEHFTSKKLLIATGSAAYSRLSGGDDGYRLAKELGHSILPPLPTLVALKTKQKWPKSLSGIKLKANIFASTSYQEYQVKGDLLFSDYGISGLCVLDLSFLLLEAIKKRDSIQIKIELLPELDSQKLIHLLRESASVKISNLSRVGALVPLKVAAYILKRLSIEPNSSSFGNKEARLVAYELKNLHLDFDDIRGIEFAEVCYGGVSAKEIDAKSMQSKLCKGLYFGGEVIDIVGKRGGFNLHFAWLSAMRIAASN